MTPQIRRALNGSSSLTPPLDAGWTAAKGRLWQASASLAAAPQEQRLETLAILASAVGRDIRDGWIPYHEGVDCLQGLAESHGLVTAHGQDKVQEILGKIQEDDLFVEPEACAATDRPNIAQGQEPSAAKGELVIQRMSEVAPEKIEWLWTGRIARGKQTLFGGEPGLGKSQLTASLAAAVSTGGDWPCGEGRAPQGNVLILSAEDGAADTIRPRLDAAGADASKVYTISAVRHDGGARRSFNLQADLELLEQAITRIGNVNLVIIDPISSYLGKTDSHKNADVRGTLEPLGEMASRHRVAVVAVTHFSKGTGNSAINSFIGSIAFVAAARAAFIVVRDPDDAGRRLVVTAKNNLAADSGGLAFRLVQSLLPGDIVASAIAWEGERVSATADDVLAASQGRGEDSPAQVEAEDFLRDVLAGGARPVKEVEAEAKDAGVAWRTVRRAQKALGIKPERRAESGDGLGKAGRWYWSLPAREAAKVANNPYVGHVSDMAILGSDGHLSDDTAAKDPAIVASIALQSGVACDTIRRALTRNRDGSASGPLGVALDALSGADPSEAAP